MIEHIWTFWFRSNGVDVIMWGIALYMSIRYGFINYNKKPRTETQGWLFVFFLSFYGVFLIVRLGSMKWIMFQLVELCVKNGLDISDIVPR